MTAAAPTAGPRTVDVLLIGGGVASVAAAEELREQGFRGSVMLVTRDLEAPYHRPPLTKDLLTGRCDRDSLACRPAAWWDERGVELRTRSAVTELDPVARRATLASKEQVVFGQALLATGAMVRRLRVDGAQLDGIHYLRAPGNAEALRRDLPEARRVAIVGGSFIATEVAASLTALGMRCTLIMQEERPLERAFGAAASGFAAALLERRGVELLGGEDVVAFEGDGRVKEVVTRSGRRIAADVVVVGAGAQPDTALARRAGLELGETGGIRCDARLRASAPGIYAAGDVCEYDSVLHGRRVRIEHEEHAIAQGRTAARNLLGEEAVHDVPPYFWSQLADWATLEYVGVESEWDDELVVGDQAGGRFTSWHVREGRVVGAVVAGGDEDMQAVTALVAARAPASSLPGVGTSTTDADRDGRGAADDADAPGAPIPNAYLRLYADADGHSRFEDVTLSGATRGVVESELRATFSDPIPAAGVVFRHVVREAADDHPHNAPRRQFIIQLTGECEIEASDGERRRMVPGTVLLVEDTEGLGHITRRVGEQDRLTLVIPLP